MPEWIRRTQSLIAHLRWVALLALIPFLFPRWFFPLLLLLSNLFLHKALSRPRSLWGRYLFPFALLAVGLDLILVTLLIDLYQKEASDLYLLYGLVTFESLFLLEGSSLRWGVLLLVIPLYLGSQMATWEGEAVWRIVLPRLGFLLLLAGLGIWLTREARNEYRRRRALERLQCLLRLSQSLSRRPSLEEWVETVAREAQHQTRAEQVAVLLLRPGSQRLYVATSLGSFPLAQGQEILEGEGGAFLRRWEEGQEWVEPLETANEEACFALGFPLRMEEEVIGLLYAVLTPQEFTLEEEGDLLRALATYLATALELMRLFQQLEEQATRDALTGLYNRGHFFALLEREIEKYHRYGQQSSLLLFDIDFFKRVNDTYGHRTGDQVLRTLAQTLQNRWRRTDILARYGGEEFVILLPHTPKEGAAKAAERLRNVVASLRFEGPGGEPFSVTVSVGVAHCPCDATTPETLLEAADQALYQAKRSGRNRICLFTASEQRSTVEGGP